MSRSIISTFATLAAACAATGCLVFYEPAIELAPLPRTKGLAVQRLADVLSLPEEEIDVGRAALLVAKEHRSELDLDNYLARLDELAARLRRKLPEGISAEEAVERLVEVVQPEGTPPPVPVGDATPGGLPPQIDIAKMLDGARGNCLGISLLYLAVAERVGLPIHGVSAPEHFFVRFDDGVTRINIEPTLGGRVVSDREYRDRRNISPDAESRGVYLRTESKRQVIASLIANRAGYHALSGMSNEALQDANRALAIKPYWPQAYVNRGLAYEILDQPELAEKDYHSALQFDPNCAGALNNLAAMYVRRARDGESTDTPQGLAKSAEKYIQKALSIFPARAEFHETAAAVAAARGHLKRAARHLRRAIQIDPANKRYRKKLLAIQGE
jgi:regulator of sirC expression with transglutaminase-like and TPR domain